MKTDEAAREEVEALLEVKTESVGGGNDVFMFYGSRNIKAEKDLIFGWANGALGYQLMHEDGACLEAGELFANATAYAQAWFIRATCERLGYKIENVPAPGAHDPQACENDQCAECAALDPHMTEEGINNPTRVLLAAVEAVLNEWTRKNIGSLKVATALELRRAYEAAKAAR